MIPDKFLKMSLLGYKCSVKIEKPDEGTCEVYAGHGVNTEKSLFIMYYIENTLHFLTNKTTGAEIPEEVTSKSFGNNDFDEQPFDLNKPRIILVWGSPVSDKETQAAMLAEKYKFKYINVNDLVQEEINDASSKKGAE